jgi:hypothetical protein
VRKDVALLLGVLVASNAAWAWFAFGQPRADPEPDQPTSEELVQLGDRAGETEAGLTKSGPVLVGAKPAHSGTDRSVRVGSDPLRDAVVASELLFREHAKRSREHKDEVESQVASWQRDVLQVADAAKREDALRAMESALVSKDALLVSACLQSVYMLRPLEQELVRFRPVILSRLDDENATIRERAVRAFLSLPREEGDPELILARLDRATPDESALLDVALTLNHGNAEGAVGDAFVRLLAGADDRHVMAIAHVLRNRWVSAKVEEAVLAAWKRRDVRDLKWWPQILGEMRPTREPRLRAIIAWIPDPDLVPQLHVLKPALTEHMDVATRPLAARLALEALSGFMDPEVRRLLLTTVRHNGTAEHAPALRAFADGSSGRDAERALAREFADELNRKKR